MANEAQVNIVNMALGHLGDLNKKVKRMETFSRAGCGTNAVLHTAFDFYQAAKEEMHAMMDWSRTRKVVALTKDSADPLVDEAWTYKYQRPPDCLIFRRLIDENENEYDFAQVNEASTAQENLNNEFIYANIDDALGWYTILIGEERYVPGMARLQAMILARDLAMSVTGDAKVRFAFAEEMERRTKEYCMSLGATEGYVEKEAGKRSVTDCF